VNFLTNDDIAVKSMDWDDQLRRVQYLFDMLQAEVSSGHFSLYDIRLETAAFTEYLELTSTSNPMRIGTAGQRVSGNQGARPAAGGKAVVNVSNLSGYFYAKTGIILSR
jgi:hypothetical protein